MDRQIILKIPITKTDLIGPVVDYLGGYGYEVIVNPEGLNDVSPAFFIYDVTWRDEIMSMVLDRLDCDSLTFVFWPYKSQSPSIQSHYRLFTDDYFDIEELQALIVIGAECYFDPEEGGKWFVPAAIEDKNPFAMEYLADAYSVGKWGMPQDSEKAARLYEEAFNCGHSHMWIQKFERQKAQNPDLTL